METQLRDLLAAIQFAATRHRTQKRKDLDESPYINHPIDVANVLAQIGDVADLDVLRAAILHDTIEDTDTSEAELRMAFGARVAEIVAAVTDDKSLEKAERKRLQIEHARTISPAAKLVKLGDKICNVRDVTHAPPPDWDRERRVAYLDWSERVVAGCRGVNAALEARFDAVLREGRDALAS